MNEHGICQSWVGSFQCYYMIWLDITLESLPSIEIIHIIDRSCSINLELGMRTSEAVLSYWASEPCWVKQSQSWPIAFMRSEREINTCLNSLRFWSVYDQRKTETTDIKVCDETTLIWPHWLGQKWVQDPFNHEGKISTFDTMVWLLMWKNFSGLNSGWI